MSWLAGLSLGAAIRWALAWPLAVLVVIAAIGAWMMTRAMDFAINLQTYPHVPWWVPLTLAALLVLFAPPLAFLGMWVIARRTGP